MKIKFLNGAASVGKFDTGGTSTGYDDTAIIALANTKIPLSEKGQANGVATLDSTGLIPSNQLPSYVDDILEFNNLASFPVNGESGKIYLAMDTNKIYRFSGSTYVNITIGAGTADSATKLATARSIGGVNFDGTANINLPGVNAAGNQNTTGNSATATKLATVRTIGGVSFDGTANINLPGVNTAGTQNTTGNSATATKLATPRKINSVDFDGTADITIVDNTKLATSGGTITGNITITGTTTLMNALPVTSGGTGVTTVDALKNLLGVPQFIQITLENYNLLSDIEKNNPSKVYLIIG